MGFPIEFMTEKKIKEKYDKVTTYVKKPTNSYIKGLYSDDTQMTIATIKAILDTKEKKSFDLYSLQENLMIRYKEWYLTQMDFKERRAPGLTCLNAMKHHIDKNNKYFNIPDTINDSKGYGGIMRVAPLGLLPLNLNDSIVVGNLAAYITHNHILGYWTSGYLTGVINCLSDGLSLIDSISKIQEIFSKNQDKHIKNELIPLVDKAISLSLSDKTDLENINSLGEGWIAEETLAIALYCSLRYEKDYYNGVCASINHKGDSDSTGCVAGAILGFINGFDSIPENLINEIENKKLLNSLSERLFSIMQ